MFFVHGGKAVIDHVRADRARATRGQPRIEIDLSARSTSARPTAIAGSGATPCTRATSARTNSTSTAYAWAIAFRT